MITTQQLHWLAALLEGEGCFHSSASGTVIIIKMTDLDVIEKFRILTNTTNMKITVIPGTNGWKTRYSTSINGNKAIQWMMTLYTLMGIRRKEKIKDIIEKWKINYYKKATADKSVKYRSSEYKATKALAIQKNISMEEAEKLMNELLGKTIQ